MMYLRMRLISSLLIFGVGLLFFGYREYQDAQHVRADPTRISCVTFESRGTTDDNNHIELSSFAVTEDMWHAAMSPTASSTYYDSVWIPVFPKNRGVPDGPDMHVILRFNGVKGEPELETLLEKAVVTGVVNPKGCLPGDARKLLEECYPGLDCKTCYVVGVGQSVPSVKRAMGCMAAGGGCLMIFGGYMFWSFKNPSTTKYGGDAKVDTTSPEFMSKRISTELDPEKFRQAEMLKGGPPPAQPAAAGNDFDNGGDFTELTETDLAPPTTMDDEELAYRRQFAERYGMAADTMDTGEGENASDAQMLNY